MSALWPPLSLANRRAAPSWLDHQPRYAAFLTPSPSFLHSSAGSESAISLLIDYKPFARADLYGGVMVSNVYGGLASGYFKPQNIDPTVGLRIRF